MKALFALLTCFATATLAQALPREVSAEYELTSFGVRVGRVSETFVRKDDTYAIESVTRSEGALKVFLDDQVTLQSQGTVGPAGLKPRHFGQKRARDSRRDVDATFDWERRLLVSRVGGETHEVPLPEEAQDRISLMYQFMNLSPGSGPMTVWMSNGRKVERYAYRLVEAVRIATPAGEFDTLHYARVTENPRESRADVWLARDRFHLPVRVVFDDAKGLRLEQNLLSLRTSP